MKFIFHLNKNANNKFSAESQNQKIRSQIILKHMGASYPTGVNRVANIS